MTISTLLSALLAAGLAVALSREHRIRRAFQELAARLLEKLRGATNHQTGYHTGPHSHSPRRRR